ncbi:MAG: primosomal protein N' [Dehalococcoidales bacterium]|jgi:primosomal protein N' (replication factor Y)|nr:primosomal protein N' [Dehalococcoidales bacterium]
MIYAEVSVNSPFAGRRTFCYEVPSDLTVSPGQAVWVPFGEKILQGIVVTLTSSPSVPETRPITGIIEDLPLLEPHQVELAVWLSNYYLVPLFESFALMLPPGFELRVYAVFSPASGVIPEQSSLKPEEDEILKLIHHRGKISLPEIKKIYGSKRSQKILAVLSARKLVNRNYVLERPRIKPRYETMISLGVSIQEAAAQAAKLERRSARQADLIRYLMDNSQPQSLSSLKKGIKITSAVLKSLAEKGVIKIEEQQVIRDPLSSISPKLPFSFTLTASQQAVLDEISQSLRSGVGGSARPHVFLLYGVTGSGKTEIYIRALEEAVRNGRKGIVMVPEIAMTPQMIERFTSRFPGRVAVLHSALSLGERFDEWWRIRNGEFLVVIGPRSAVFSPQPDLGLIVIDEEHEWTYKQEENSPRYHAREVALKLAELTGATVVLGSATPSVETYHRAQQGEFKLLVLPERLTPVEKTPLPEVQVVDLRKELKDGNLSLFSRVLCREIESALGRQEQVLLFLNRRGGASIVECRDCGWVIRCRRCNVALTYHFAESREGILICHQCNYRLMNPRVCPNCGSRKIKFLGAGTEKLEEEARRFFPQARILRWDSEVASGNPELHQRIYNRMVNHEVDILIGTQIVAKGLDLPRITLVGVVNADTILNFPDFRAGERTFQLLCQVAGRAGRGYRPGKVIVQTYTPGHYAIQAAARHDYNSFFQQEIAYRQNLHYPPFSSLARLVYAHTSEIRCQAEAEKLLRILLNLVAEEGWAGITFIGPAPAFISRLRGRYRWQVLLKGYNLSDFLQKVALPQGWLIDIDPVDLT